MQALVYRRSVPRYLACQLVSGLRRRRFYPALAPLRLEERPFSPPEGWVQLKVRLCGICGSDISLLRGGESYLMEPYASLPAVLGHEVVAEVLTDHPAGFTKGQRVAVEPLLSCAQRGLPPCPSCAQGHYNLCECFTLGSLQPGMVLGYNADIGGGMAEFMAAHPERLLPLPDELPDETAVLLDSLASALQPVLDNFPADDEQVLVFGAGIIGQHIVRCLRGLGSKARILVVARHNFQKELALAGGADQVLMSPDRKTLGQALGARFLPTTLGGGNLEGGAGLCFDCVGSARSLQDGLLCLRARGRYVMVATAGTLKGVDLSPLWFRELTLRGSNCYAQGTFRGETVRTYALALQLLTGPYPTEGLVRHVFPLAEWERAFVTAFDKRGTQSMKVALRPGA